MALVAVDLGAVVSPLLYRSVQDRIKRYILEHDLQGGDALPPETQLTRDLGVSRSSVREGVKALESLGILETRPGKGLYVRPFSLDPILDNLAYSLLFDRNSIVELLAVREQLEVGLLPLAVGALSPAQLELLHSLVRRQREKAERGESPLEEDRFFHRTIMEATGNHLALKLLDVFWVVLLRARDRRLAVDEAPQRTWRNHEQILAAIERGDAPAAQQAMAAHFTDIEDRVAHAVLRPRLSSTPAAGAGRSPRPATTGQNKDGAGGSPRPATTGQKKTGAGRSPGPATRQKRGDAPQRSG
jgi:DNA-binding FadR family transcriptional regulator